MKTLTNLDLSTTEMLDEIYDLSQDTARQELLIKEAQAAGMSNEEVDKLRRRLKITGEEFHPHAWFSW